MSVWRCEVYYEISGDDFAAPAAYVGFVKPQTGVVFVCRDESNTDSRWFGLVVAKRWASSSAFETIVECRFGTAYLSDSYNFIDGAGNLLYTFSVADGGTGCRTGGTIAIEKDSDLDEVRFITPLGNYTHTLSALSVSSSTTVRADITQFFLQAGGIDTSLVLTAHWRSFFASLDGTPFQGAELSAAQPGTWSSWAYVLLEAIAFESDSQDTSEATVTLSWDDSILGDNKDRTRITRTWAGGDNISPIVREIDMVFVPEHGMVARVYAYSATPGVLRLQRTFNDGADWSAEYTVHSGATVGSAPRTVRSPSVEWHGGNLVVIWSDGDNVVRKISRSYGRHWDSVTALLTKTGSFNPTMPGFCIHPYHGLLFLFYVESLSGKVYLKRSQDFGNSWMDADEGILIYTGAAARWIDCWVAENGMIRVIFESGGGGGVSYTSHSLGRYWELDVEWIRVDGTTRYRSAPDIHDGLSRHVYWYSDSVNGYASSDGGELATPTFVSSLIDTPVPEQTAGISLTADGGCLVSYFDPDEVLQTQKSKNFAQNWFAP